MAWVSPHFSFHQRTMEELWNSILCPFAIFQRKSSGINARLKEKSVGKTWPGCWNLQDHFISKVWKMMDLMDLQWKCLRAHPTPLWIFEGMGGFYPAPNSSPPCWHEPLGTTRDPPQSPCNLSKGPGAPTFPSLELSKASLDRTWSSLG